MPKYHYAFPVADRTLINQAGQLASWTNELVPPLVEAVEQLFEKSGAWYLLNRNEEAFDCKQAATVRHSLGQDGIELSRELKSFLGFFIDEAGAVQKVAVHCRATAVLDHTKIKNALQITGEFRRLELSRDESVNDAGVYGLVNPFALELASLGGDVTMQLFDADVFRADQLPPTLVTNAGDRTWAVEFQACDLSKIIPARRFLQAEVVVKSRSRGKPVIGILTGNSPESGELLWDRLTKAAREIQRRVKTNLTGDVYMPKVLLRSVPAMGMTMELHLREEQIWVEISREIEEMCQELQSGPGQTSNILAIACNTTPYFSIRISSICERYNVRFISIVDAIERFLDANGIRRFVLLGIGYVQRPEHSGYARFFRRSDIEVVPISEGALSDIEKLAYDVKEGRPIHECSQELNNILRKYGMMGENLVVALTELSLVVVGANWNKQRKATGSLVDGVEVYANTLAELFCSIDQPDA